MPLIIGELIARIEVTSQAPRQESAGPGAQVAAAEERRWRALSTLRMERERRFDQRSDTGSEREES